MTFSLLTLLSLYPYGFLPYLQLSFSCTNEWQIINTDNPRGCLGLLLSGSQAPGHSKGAVPPVPIEDRAPFSSSLVLPLAFQDFDG